LNYENLFQPVQLSLLLLLGQSLLHFQIRLRLVGLVQLSLLPVPSLLHFQIQLRLVGSVQLSLLLKLPLLYFQFRLVQQGWLLSRLWLFH
jgi:hypothetical protein